MTWNTNRTFEVWIRPVCGMVRPRAVYQPIGDLVFPHRYRLRWSWNHQFQFQIWLKYLIFQNCLIWRRFHWTCWRRCAAQTRLYRCCLYWSSTSAGDPMDLWKYQIQKLWKSLTYYSVHPIIDVHCECKGLGACFTNVNNKVCRMVLTTQWYVHVCVNTVQEICGVGDLWSKGCCDDCVLA